MARTRSILWDLLAGAAAGGLGTVLMGPVTSTLYKGTSAFAKVREKAASSDPAPVKAAKRALDVLGIHLPKKQTQLFGEVVHYGYGMAWGALYGVVRRRQSKLPHLAGILFGAALWLVSDELLNTAFGFAARPNRYPPQTHLRGLAAHLAYGASVEEGVWLMKRALA